MVGISVSRLDHVLLRQAVSLSLAAGTPVCVEGGFRYIRENPAVQPLVADWENALSQMNAGQFSGAGDDLIFTPGAVRYGNFSFVTGAYSSAVEIVLLLLPALASREFRSSLTIKGATHASISHSTDFVRETLFSYGEEVGIYASMALKRFGFYGSGGGILESKIYPREPRGAELRDGLAGIECAGARVYIAKHSSDIAKRQKEMLCDRLRLPDGKVGIIEVLDTDGYGNVIQIYCVHGSRMIVTYAIVDAYSHEGELMYSGNSAEHAVDDAVRRYESMMRRGKMPVELVRELMPVYAVANDRITVARDSGVIDDTFRIIDAIFG